MALSRDFPVTHPMNIHAVQFNAALMAIELELGPAFTMALLFQHIDQLANRNPALMQAWIERQGVPLQ